jgi:hypothetical protein
VIVCQLLGAILIPGGYAFAIFWRQLVRNRGAELVALWEEIKAEEERQAAEEAELFKSKTRSIEIVSEEQVWACLLLCTKNAASDFSRQTNVAGAVLDTD